MNQAVIALLVVAVAASSYASSIDAVRESFVPAVESASGDIQNLLASGQNELASKRVDSLVDSLENSLKLAAQEPQGDLLQEYKVKEGVRSAAFSLEIFRSIAKSAIASGNSAQVQKVVENLKGALNNAFQYLY